MNTKLNDTRLVELLRSEVAIGDMTEREKLIGKMVWLVRQQGWFTDEGLRGYLAQLYKELIALAK